MDAIRAGKDVFCEKPITLNIGEADALKSAIPESKHIFQSGMQQRSMTHFQTARDEYIKAGKLGKVTLVRTWWHGSVSSFVKPVPAELQSRPADLDWKRFIEPTDKNRPYHPYQYNCFRAFFDFGGGQFTDLFTHWVDAAHMLIGEDIPVSANASGGQFHPRVTERRQRPHHSRHGRCGTDLSGRMDVYLRSHYGRRRKQRMDLNSAVPRASSISLVLASSSLPSTQRSYRIPRPGSRRSWRGAPCGPFSLQRPPNPLTIGVRAAGGTSTCATGWIASNPGRRLAPRSSMAYVPRRLATFALFRISRAGA